MALPRVWNAPPALGVAVRAAVARGLGVAGVGRAQGMEEADSMKPCSDCTTEGGKATCTMNCGPACAATDDQMVLCMTCGDVLPASTGFAPQQLKKKRPKCRACTGGSGAKMSATAAGGHASKAENARAQELRAWERAGVINDLREQVRFELIPRQMNGDRLVEHACAYVADFVYRDASHARHVEDVKGHRTDVYRIKKKLMLWVHGIEVEEVRAERRKRG